jgi:ATP-dependent protease La
MSDEIRLRDGAAVGSPTPAESQSSGPDNSTPAVPDVLPILPLRGMVLFPGSVVPLNIQRESSLKLLDASLSHSKVIGLVSQRNGETENPAFEELHTVGVAANVLKLIRQPNDSVVLVVQAFRRIVLGRLLLSDPFFKAEVTVPQTSAPAATDKFWQAEVKNLREDALKLISLTPDVPEQAGVVISNIEEGGALADFLAPNLAIDVAQKQALLEEFDDRKRVRAVQTHIAAQLEITQIQQKLQKDVASQFSDVQRRAYLREQLKAIQRELGEGEAGPEEQVQQLRTRLEEARPPAEVLAQAERELKRLDFIPPASPEYSVIVSYIETIAGLPWNTLSEDTIDLDEARRILDRDHFGLEKVKRRIIEYLAVRKLNPDGRGPILCFLGPPGVGKTSLGQSIADALGRKFARISLGGLRDEAEIRGHRRTYIGSMPGRLIQEIRRVGTRNPVLMLDEIDKIGADFRGDPASALLEVLDPRQNQTFVDRYLDVPFDLSKVIFIATANYLDPVPAPLLDRMEVLNIPGYTDREKREIASRYLVRRQLTENGLKPKQCVWEDGAIERVIADYTHEAGVRNLERQIASVCRGVAARIAGGEAKSVRVTPKVVAELLGPPRYTREKRLKKDLPGVVTGLAYTPVGGEVLHIEATRYPGNGGITLTGQIGNVMKESAQAALSLVRSRAKKLGIDEKEFRKSDIHVHVPAGAVPKDGPSAGVAMFTALASLFTNQPVRADVGMTGEITLRGLVLPIGGLKEKTLAAQRAGLKTVIIPKANKKDLPEIPSEVRDSLHFVFAETVDDVLAEALAHPRSGGEKGKR